MGLQRLAEGEQMRRHRGSGQVCLLESFASITGARRALEILGVLPSLHFVSKFDKRALTVIRANIREAVEVGDSTKVSAKSLKQNLDGHDRIIYAIHVAGSPCQGLSGLSVTGLGLQRFLQCPCVRSSPRRQRTSGSISGGSHSQRASKHDEGISVRFACSGSQFCAGAVNQFECVPAILVASGEGGVTGLLARYGLLLT